MRRSKIRWTRRANLGPTKRATPDPDILRSAFGAAGAVSMLGRRRIGIRHGPIVVPRLDFDRDRHVLATPI
jgi:hypothetical protein